MLQPQTIARVAQSTARPATVRWLALGCVAACAVLALSGCGNKDANATTAPTQVAAKVNKDEISVHQINFALQRVPGLTAENVEDASRGVLERLISQELAVQQARELKLDRNPQVVQSLEAARREVLARAYAESLVANLPKPTAQEVAEYYAKNPALFRERKVYALLELTIAAEEPKLAEVKQQARTRSAKDFTNWLKASGLKYQVRQLNHGAESIPLFMLTPLSQVADGKSMIMSQRGGARVTYVLQTQAAPIDEATAKPSIEQFLMSERRRQKIDAEIKNLRSQAKVELVGKFAQAAAPAGAAGAAAAAPAATFSEPTAPSTAPAAAPPADSVSRGLGLK